MYGTSSFGMTVHFHYCCGKLKAVDFQSPKKKDCPAGKMQHMGTKPCCDDTKVDVKLTGEQAPTAIFHPSFHTDAVLPVHHDYFISSPFVGKKLVPEIFAPPPQSTQPLFILNCVFRI